LTNVDEIKNFLDLRYVSAPEAVWRIFEFYMHEQSHTIMRLACHLINEQPVYFHPGEEQEALDKADLNNSTLTAFFELNKNDFMAHKYLYHEIPKHYTLNKKKWQLRKNEAEDVIGRIYLVNPNEGERFYLRLLLLHVKGATSFENLRSPHDTFFDACIGHGLLRTDSEWDNCLNEASTMQTPKQLRQLFCTICVFCRPINAFQLYEKYLDQFIEDFIFANDSREIATNKCLHEFSEFFKIHNLSCTHFRLPEPVGSLITEQVTDFEEETRIGNLLKSKCNAEQLNVVNTVIQSVFEKTQKA